jgi:membrane protein implicated in regulation of membrane protease activity
VGNIVLWFGIKTYIGIEYGFINVVPSFIMSMCGMSVSLLMFLQINYLRKKRANGIKIKTKKNKNKSNSDFIGYSIYTNPKFKKRFYDKLEQNYWLIKEKTDKQIKGNVELNSLTDEEKLDQILDKINTFGQSNLTKQELEFLNYYSNKL